MQNDKDILIEIDVIVADFEFAVPIGFCAVRCGGFGDDAVEHISTPFREQ